MHSVGMLTRSRTRKVEPTLAWTWGEGGREGGRERCEHMRKELRTKRGNRRA